MGRHEHLPIYKAALDMAVRFEKLVEGFSRYRKYTLGTELHEGSRAVLQQVLRANNAKTGLNAAPNCWCCRPHRSVAAGHARGQGGESVQEFCRLPACRGADELGSQTERGLVCEMICVK